MRFIRLHFLLILIASAAALSCDAEARANWTKRVGAKAFPNATTVFWANDFGAKPDTGFLSTAAIQSAVEAAFRSGGGIVALKDGHYHTGAIFLKANVHLRIDDGVELLGSQDFRDYPEIDTRIAGIEMRWPAALINVIDQKNVAITGSGRINARGKFCWDKYWAMRKDYEARGLRWIVDYDAKRVRTILVQNSEDVTLKGLTIANAGFWTIQLLYSTRLSVNGITIRNNEAGKGPSTDGIDVDSSTWALIENCDIDCNDDDFCLKAGRDWDGLRVNRPTEYVVIRNCIARRGGGLLTLGSETSGGIRHVLATNLRASGTGTGFHIKSALTRGGTVEDIRFEHANLDRVKTVFKFTMNWNPAYSYSKLPEGIDSAAVPDHWKKLLHPVEPVAAGIPHFRDVRISNVQADHAVVAVEAAGIDSSRLDRFVFNRVNVRSTKAGNIRFGRDWDLKTLQIGAADGMPLKIEDSNNILQH